MRRGLRWVGGVGWAYAVDSSEGEGGRRGLKCWQGQGGGCAPSAAPRAPLTHTHTPLGAQRGAEERRGGRRGGRVCVCAGAACVCAEHGIFVWGGGAVAG